MLPEAVTKLLAARAALSGFETPLGTEILIWLLKSPEQARAVKDLYRSSRFSQATIRTFLTHQADRGLVALHPTANDKRQRFAQATPKLIATVEAYRSLILKLISATAHEPPEPNLAAAD